MKKFIIILSVLIIVFCSLTSCSSSQNIPSADDSYAEGLEQGYEDVFLNLWWASAPGANILEPGELWETDHFSLRISSDKNEQGMNIHIELTTHNISISECFDDQKMLFNVFSYDGNQFDGLLTDDLFYMYALLEEVTDNTAHATVGVYDTTDRIAILLAIGGSIYKATYYIT